MKHIIYLLLIILISSITYAIGDWMGFTSGHRYALAQVYNLEIGK